MHSRERRRYLKGLLEMKAKWKFTVEGESSDAREIKRLLLILAMIILILVLVELGPQIMIYLR